VFHLFFWFDWCESSIDKNRSRHRTSATNVEALHKRTHCVAQGKCVIPVQFNSHSLHWTVGSRNPSALTEAKIFRSSNCFAAFGNSSQTDICHHMSNRSSFRKSKNMKHLRDFGGSLFSTWFPSTVWLFILFWSKSSKLFQINFI
jgi:hypothetical protein